jgi:ABC-2 type transport system ATP-binding protein
VSDFVLDVKGVTKTFGQVQALRGIDLAVPRGGIFGLVGPNGAGKTTLFSIICGLVGADTGTVNVGGLAISPGHSPPAGKLAMLPQDAAFLSGVTVGAQLAYYARLGGMERVAALKEVARVLGLVGLPEVATRTADTLSHGMRKRVGIAQAYIGNPELVILDEPTAGLDPQAARDIRATLRTMNTQTIMVSTHDLAEVEDLCNEVAILNQGKVARQDTVANLVGAAAEISFRLTAAPADKVMVELRALPLVADASFDVGAGRLRVTFDPKKTPSDEAASTLLAFFVGRGVAIMEMQVGKRLEDRFLEETKKKS